MGAAVLQAAAHLQQAGRGDGEPEAGESQRGVGPQPELSSALCPQEPQSDVRAAVRLAHLEGEEGKGGGREMEEE